MPRFVILRHAMPPNAIRGLHWDLMLEDGSVLKTWALGSPPARKTVIPAEALPDHRLAYLDYEGPVSGNRGTVTQWDAGTFEWLSRSEDSLRFQLQGRRVQVMVTLRRDKDTDWSLTCEGER